MKKIDISNTELQHLYKYKKCNIYKIAAIYNCSIATISQRLKEYKINTWWKAANIEYDVLQELYIEKRMTMKEIAENLNCSQTTIVAKIHKYGIKSRKKKFSFTAQDLNTLYAKDRKCQWVIARERGCSQAMISKRMKRFKIPVRSKSELSSRFMRFDFSGNLIEKAHMIGFRIGDLHVRKHRLLVSVSTTTTRPEQIYLFEDMFEKYGHIRIIKRIFGYGGFINVRA